MRGSNFGGSVATVGARFSTLSLDLYIHDLDHPYRSETIADTNNSCLAGTHTFRNTGFSSALLGNGSPRLRSLTTTNSRK